MDIYLVRHGQTDHNLTGRFSGQADIPMNETGRSQIRSVKPYLEGITWDRVLSSPLIRAVETARILAPDKAPELCEWLKEMDFGTWTGKTWAEVEKSDPVGAKAYERDWKARVGGAESYYDVAGRVEEGIRNVVKETAPDAKILIAGHAASVVQITLTLLSLPKDSYWRWMPGQGTYALLQAFPSEDLFFYLGGWNLGRHV